MKRLPLFLLVATILLSCVVPASAADGNVTYFGITQEFIFQPGGEHSLTDLFPNFKDVMPGDNIAQKITVKNDQNKNVKVEIYVRSLGAHEGSQEFLSQMGLRVRVLEGEMDYMFNAYANETAQMTDWVCLGMLYSGGKVDLYVILDVPVTMGNEFQDQIGYLDWEFKVIEYPVDDDDPKPPQTGDDTQILPMVAVGTISMAAALFLILFVTKRKKEAQQ